MNWVAVFVGGGLGSLCRYGLAVWGKQLQFDLPYATFIANILACVILAISAMQFSNRMNTDQMWQILIMAGFCGGFSTFSTFSFETAVLIKSGHWLWALTNVVISTVTGVGVIWYLLFRN